MTKINIKGVASYMKIKLEGNIGNNIRQLRKANHLSQEELAQKCNVSRQTISRWESNEVR